MLDHVRPDRVKLDIPIAAQNIVLFLGEAVLFPSLFREAVSG
jgi:hypothetical protein